MFILLAKLHFMKQKSLLKIKFPKKIWPRGGGGRPRLG